MSMEPDVRAIAERVRRGLGECRGDFGEKFFQESGRGDLPWDELTLAYEVNGLLRFFVIEASTLDEILAAVPWPAGSRPNGLMSQLYCDDIYEGISGSADGFLSELQAAVYDDSNALGRVRDHIRMKLEEFLKDAGAATVYVFD